MNWNYTQSAGIRDSGLVKGTLSVTDSTGKQEFIARDGGIRVPTAGTYKLTIYWSSGSSTFTATIHVRAGGNEVYTKTFNSSNSETVVVNADMGKFDLVELRGEFYYSGSATSSFLAISSTITIQQL